MDEVRACLIPNRSRAEERDDRLEAANIENAKSGKAFVLLMGYGPSSSSVIPITIPKLCLQTATP